MTKGPVPLIDGMASNAPTAGSVTVDGLQRRRRRFIGAIDQGTTSTRFIIFDSDGSLVASHQTELRAIHRYSG